MNAPNLNSIQVQQSIQREFISSVLSAKEIENQHETELEELAVQAALNVTETPEGKYEIDAKLTGGPGEIGAEGFQFEPEVNYQMRAKKKVKKGMKIFQMKINLMLEISQEASNLSSKT
jgi:hypothetical protein